MQAKEKVIDFLTSRLEKVRNTTQNLISEDQMNKSTSMKSLVSQAQSLVEEISTRDNYRAKYNEA